MDDTLVQVKKKGTYFLKQTIRSQDPDPRGLAKSPSSFRSAERAAPVLILSVKEIQFSDAVSTKDDKHSGVRQGKKIKESYVC